MITCEWKTLETPNAVPYLVRHAEVLRQAGIHLDVFYFRGAGNPLRYLHAWLRARKTISENSYDLVHAQWGQSGLMALPKRLPLVVTFMGSDLEGLIGSNGRYTFWGRILTCLSKFVARTADQVVVVSESLVRHLPPRYYSVIPHGLDLAAFQPTSRFEARAQLGLPLDKKLVLFAADPENPIKRFQLAASAVNALKLHDVELVVAKGVCYSQMPAYMNACDVLLLTSFHEGSPNVVKEALACNLPVVSVDVGDVRQRIASIDGCVTCADDPSAIASALAEVLTRGKRIDGRRTVLALDERVLTAKLIKVYEQAKSLRYPMSGKAT